MQKVIFHLEAFVAKFMRIYERSVPHPSEHSQAFPKPFHLLTDAQTSWTMGMDFD